jgi:serine/threonine-protein kinase
MNTGEAPAQDPPRFEPKPGVVVADKFQLIREIGRGGMASVWVAKHLGLDGLVAVKFIDESFAHPTARARFEREARAAARLRSPHVVQVFDYGVWQGTPYIAMEYLEGEDLGARLKAVGRLAPVDTVRVVCEVARALMKAHNEGIVHRDLKPANVFLARDIDREHCKVLDFGIAKTPDPRPEGTLQGSGQVVGTPEYMSPEQATAVDVIDWRSDLWSLAVIAFRCLTGTNPFETTSVTATLLRVAHDPIPMPSGVVSDLPPAVDAWWQRATQRRPEERFQSAKALAQSLADALGLPIDSVLRESTPQLPQQTRAEHAPDSTRLGHAATISTGATPKMPIETPIDAGPRRGAPARRMGLQRQVLIAAAGAVVLVGIVVALLRGRQAPPSGGPAAPAAVAAPGPRPPAPGAPAPEPPGGTATARPAATPPSQEPPSPEGPAAAAGTQTSAPPRAGEPRGARPAPARARKPARPTAGGDKFEFGF